MKHTKSVDDMGLVELFKQIKHIRSKEEPLVPRQWTFSIDDSVHPKAGDYFLIPAECMERIVQEIRELSSFKYGFLLNALRRELKKGTKHD